MAHIGILGGSFDPVHNGHLAIAQAVRQAGGLDEVWLTPAKWSPLKSPHVSAGAEHRLAMLKLAVAGQAGLDVCDLELNRAGRSYTFDTMTELGLRHPQHEFSWIVGADNLATLPQWYRSRELVAGWRIWIAARPGYDLEADLRTLQSVQGKELTNRLRQGMLATPLVDISATEIRRRLHKGENIRAFIPSAVAEYIFRHKLYEAT